MDDLFHGGDSIQECQEQIKKITKTMDAGNFPLTKWVSNNEDVLANIDSTKKIEAYEEISDKSQFFKELVQTAFESSRS